MCADSVIDMVELTEEKEMEIERSEKKRRNEAIKAVRDKFQRRYNTAEENYNSAGDGRSYSAMIRNEQLIDICNLALQSLEDGCAQCARKERNAAENRRRLRAMNCDSIPLETAINFLYI